jgi:sugar lactone lactonase YvrE
MKISILVISLACLLSTQGLSLAQQGAAVPATPPADAPQVQQEIRDMEATLAKFPDRGTALFFLAHDYAHLGNFEKALASLKECISLEEGFDPEGDPVFRPMKDNPEFNKLIERIHQRYPAVHQAQAAFTIPEKDLVPEGLAVNSSTGDLYMGSLNLRKIVRITKTGVISDFVKAGQYDLGFVCGIKVDPADSSLWVNVCPDSGVGAELVHFDSAGKLLERFPPSTSGQHLFNDLVLRNDREIYLTDSLANRAYRFDRRSHTFTELTFPRAIYYPNGIALSDDGNWLYVADAFGILQVNLRSNNAKEVDPGPTNTVSGADGLYWYKNTLIAVQNSLGSSRIAQFRLSPDGLKVAATIILEYRSPSVTLPTTGAIYGTKFYFMSNTQVDNFKDGKIVDPAKLEPVRISVVELQH